MALYGPHPNRPSFPTALAILLILSGCAGSRVQMSDSKVEEPLRAATGVTTEQVQAALSKKEIGLWDAYALAVERTERMAYGAENREQAYARRQQAIGSILPEVALRATQGYEDNSGGSFFKPAKNLSLTGRQPILTGLDEVATVKAAGAEIRMREAEMRHDGGRLLLDLARSFFLVLQLEESKTAKESIRKLTEETLKDLKGRVALGRSRQSERLNAEAQLARIDAELEELSDLLAQGRGDLSLLAGVDPGQSLVETSDIPPASANPGEAESLAEKRWDVKAAREALNLSKAQYLAAVGGHFPEISVQGNYYLHREGGSSDKKWDALLVAELPVFSGGKVSGEAREAASRKRQAELDLSRLRREALREIRESFASHESSLKQKDAYEKALKAAEDNYKFQQQDFRLSLTTNLEVLTALSSLQNARDSYARARYQLLVNRVRLGVATGELPKISIGN